MKADNDEYAQLLKTNNNLFSKEKFDNIKAKNLLNNNDIIEKKKK